MINIFAATGYLSIQTENAQLYLQTMLEFPTKYRWYDLVLQRMGTILCVVVKDIGQGCGPILLDRAVDQSYKTSFNEKFGESKRIDKRKRILIISIYLSRKYTNILW